MSVYLIGELGSCHDGDWQKVERLVAACAEAGFSACKLQYWSSADRLADRRHATDAYRAIYHTHQIPLAWLPAFRALCDEYEVEAVCTAYLPEDVERVAPYVDRIKIASFENEDMALITAALKAGKPVIVSAGMTDERALRRIRSRLMGRHYGGVLACVSAYPAALDGVLERLGWRWMDEDDCPFCDGYSDHTRNVWTGACAVACGAEIIEVHVRLDDTDTVNPDYATALSPAEFRQYAEGVCTAERLIADVPVDESAMRQFKVRP